MLKQGIGTDQEAFQTGFEVSTSPKNWFNMLDNYYKKPGGTCPEKWSNRFGSQFPKNYEKNQAGQV